MLSGAVSKGSKLAKNLTQLITVQVQVVYAGHKNNKYDYQVRVFIQNRHFVLDCCSEAF